MMCFLHCLQVAFENLRANKLRSALTMLGIIIGVSAVIMMVAIIQGFAARFERQIRKLGSDLIIVTYHPDSEERKKLTKRIAGLKMEDALAIRDDCDLIKRISPEMPLGNNSRAKYAGQDTDVSPDG